ncbi:MAG: hypothetical protein CBB97_21035 [Candidatus Endolissoclinum sp. TMED37]|nr:MAG: hypothetical protein CBB97_21035 [Candidatus Endolissoclinum sp. TMED37]
MAKSRRRSKRSRRSRRKSRKQRGGAHHEEAPAQEAPATEESSVQEPMALEEPIDAGHVGGKRKSRKSKKGKKSRKSRKGKKLNGFFKLMLDAKKKKLPSFKYNGKTYKGRLLKDKPHLGMVYKRA